MPQSINGIGTHYYGKSDLRERRGQCEFCGRSATIQSYSTRYWFVILFIPIIPLGRKRVLDQCGACRRHRAMKLADWDQLRAKALEEGMRKVVDQQGQLEPQAELLRTCLLLGEWEKADQLAARIESEFAQDPKAHLHLVAAHVYRGRAPEAQKALDRARELDPSLVKATEEQRASLAPKPAGNRRQKILLGILGAILLAGLLVADFATAHGRTLHVVNGYGIPLKVRIEGYPELSILPLAERSIEVPEGSYIARVSGPLSAELPFEISSHFIVRLFDSRTFVLNPGGMGVVVQEETLYSARNSANSAELPHFTLYYGKPFDAYKGIDYAFKPFPHEITVDHGDSVRKKRLDLVSFPIVNLFRGLLKSNRAPEALMLAEWAIDAHPSRAEMVAAYGDAAANPAYRQRILSALKSRLGRRPVEIPLHRVYQNLSLENPHHTLPNEYEAYLTADPGNSALIYLRGRLVSGLTASLPYFERAVLADPANAFAQAAAAYCRCSQGKWADALSPAVRACELDPTNADFRKVLEDIQIALGPSEPLEKELRERCARSGWIPSPSLVNLVNLLAVRGDREGAFKLCEMFEKPRAGMELKTSQALAIELRCRAFYAARDFAALALEVDKGEKSNVASHRFAVLIEQGRLDEADALAQTEEPETFQTLERSIAWFLKGNAAKAGELRRKGAELLQKPGKGPFAAAAVLLESGTLPDARLASDLDIPYFSKAIVLTALAQAHPESAPELVRQARALNAGFAFPRHLLDRALAGLEAKR